MSNDNFGPEFVDPETGEPIAPTETYTDENGSWDYYEFEGHVDVRIVSFGGDLTWSSPFGEESG